MAQNGGNTVPRITRAEHIGPNDTGDNIEAKRVVAYSWNSGTGLWERGTGEASATAVRIDEVSSTLSYIGKAPIGSATSSPVWQIAKLDSTAGLIKTWADSNANYDNVWDDRVSLSYA